MKVEIDKIFPQNHVICDPNFFLATKPIPILVFSSVNSNNFLWGGECGGVGEFIKLLM